MSQVTIADPAWIDKLCQRLTQAVGWPMAYVGDVHGEPNSLWSESTWRVDLSDGQQRLGHISLGLPELPAHDSRFAMAREVAELFGEVINRLAQAEARVECRTRELSTLVELGKCLPNVGDISRSLEQLLSAAVAVSGFWSAAFFLRGAAGEGLKLRATHHLAPEHVPHPERELTPQCPDWEALRSGFVSLERDDLRGMGWLPAGTSLAVCVPVVTEVGPVGTLWCYERRTRVLGPLDREAMHSVATQIGAALERSVLRRESLNERRLRRELGLAQEAKPSGAMHTLPESFGLEVAQRSQAYRELGGDLCELFSIDAQHAAIVIGDAVGHSIPAAVLMTMARGAIRTVFEARGEEIARTDKLLERVNKVLHDISSAEQFMTMVCGVFDIGQGVFSFSNAGHPAPYLVRGNLVVPLQAHGLILGVMPQVTYTRSTVPIQPGDVLVFYTDGLTEAMSPGRELFHSERLIEELGRCSSESAERVADSVWSALQRHLDGEANHDDCSLIVVRVGQSCRPLPQRLPSISTTRR